MSFGHPKSGAYIYIQILKSVDYRNSRIKRHGWRHTLEPVPQVVEWSYGLHIRLGIDTLKAAVYSVMSHSV